MLLFQGVRPAPAPILPLAHFVMYEGFVQSEPCGQLLVHEGTACMWCMGSILVSKQGAAAAHSSAGILT